MFLQAPSFCLSLKEIHCKARFQNTRCNYDLNLENTMARRSSTELSISRTFQLLHLFYPYESLRRQVMSTAALIHLVRNGGYQVRRRALLTSRLLQDEKRTTAECCISTSERRASRFDPDGSGRPATWDTFGIWDNRIDEPILLPPSIKYGKPIPKVSLSKVGCASHIGKRKENEDRFDYAQLTEDVLYFAVYDGHGGAAAADFCAKNMERYIKEFAAQEENLEKVLNDAFLEINKAYERHAQLSADDTVPGQQL
uniref:Protein phosphatase, Mg2+/Mn2+ dependent 1K n=1 Tax=Gallus gallus TaxID=9031 RepID=A0A8V0XGS1_CHICK